MTIYLVRHAKAGSRSKWEEPDEQRPLSKPGRRQAIALADALDGADVTRVLTSPALRCRQTVQPLAARAGISADVADGLAEGAALDRSLAILDKVIDETAVLCTHGDVVGNLLWHLERHGVHLDDDRLEKGSAWVLEVESGGVVAARYVPPPSV